MLDFKKKNREGNGNSLQYSCLGNPMDRGDWQATVHGVAELNTIERSHTHIIRLSTAHSIHSSFFFSSYSRPIVLNPVAY